MNTYTKTLRTALTDKQVHLNDDVTSVRPGACDRNYDYEEHENYSKVVDHA